jgi:RNA polymerase sigma factor (sigma-70 family)
MGLTPPTTGSDAHLRGLVHLALDGDHSAKEQLLHHAGDRLLRLTRKMFHSRPDLRRWMQTDDVFQNSLIRLHRALATVHVKSVRHFFNLATVQIRRELIDLGRLYFGPHGIGKNHHTDHHSADDEGGVLCTVPDEPDSLDDWTEFHERVERLQEEEREVVDLLFYEGMSQAEAAELLGCSIRTIRRRWADARFRLHKGLSDGPPETGNPDGPHS